MYVFIIPTVRYIHTYEASRAKCVEGLAVSRYYTVQYSTYTVLQTWPASRQKQKKKGMHAS